MADEIDLANEMMDKEVSLALLKLRQNTEQASAQGAKECMECGEPIPLGRQKLGFKLCVPCAEEQERKDSLFAS